MTDESRKYRMQLFIEYAKLLDCELDEAKRKAILTTVLPPTTRKQSRVELTHDISLMIERLMDMRASLEGPDPEGEEKRDTVGTTTYQLKNKRT